MEVGLEEAFYTEEMKPMRKRYGNDEKIKRGNKCPDKREPKDGIRQYKHHMSHTKTIFILKDNVKANHV